MSKKGGHNGSDKSVQTAVVIIPPESCWKPIQDIRRKHDKAYDRWMPHINLVYPFIPEDIKSKNLQREALRMTLALRDIKPFKVTLSGASVGSFTHRRSTILWLKPLFTPTAPGSTQIPRPIRPKPVKKPAKPKVKKATSKSKAITKPCVKPNTYVPCPETINIAQVPVVRPIPEGILLKEPSLDNLRHAFWIPGKVARETNCVVGWEALRNAVWTPGEKVLASEVTTFPVNGNLDLHQKAQKSESAWEGKEFTDGATGKSFTISTTAHDDDDDDYDDDDDDETSEDSSSTYDDDDDDDDEKGYDEDPEVIGKENEVHPSVLKLQAMLQNNYPGHDDLIQISSDLTYKPHLTLGQSPNNRAVSLTEELKKTFDGHGRADFEVNKIYIISRRGPYDPFAIRATVPLGSDAAMDPENITGFEPAIYEDV